MAKRVCVIPGEDAAPEAVLPTLGVLQAMELDIEFSELPTGEEGRARYGERWAAVCREAIDDGDIVSDEAAAIVGGLGIAPSGCYGEHFAYFEPVHGTAPDIAGTHTINPTSTLLSAAMMLEHLDLADAAARLEHAVEAVYAEGSALTPDQGGGASTERFCEAVIDRLRTVTRSARWRREVGRLSSRPAANAEWTARGNT